MEFNDMQKPSALAPKNNKKRGQVSGISRKSNARLVRQLAMIGRKDSFLFVTLTYREFDEVFSQWKKHLNQWRTELAKRYQDSAGFWRLEFQERGAPHYHVLLWFNREIDAAFADDFYQWARRSWLRIIGQQSQANKLHGVKVEISEDLRTTGFYLSLYAAKDEQDRKDIVTGRTWGMWKKERMQMKPQKEALLDWQQATLLRRVLRRHEKARTRGKVRKVVPVLGCTQYENRLLRGDRFSTYWTYEESTRLLRYVMQAESIAEHAKQFRNPARGRGSLVG